MNLGSVRQRTNPQRPPHLSAPSTLESVSQNPLCRKKHVHSKCCGNMYLNKQTYAGRQDHICFRLTCPCSTLHVMMACVPVPPPLCVRRFDVQRKPHGCDPIRGHWSPLCDATSPPPGNKQEKGKFSRAAPAFYADKRITSVAMHSSTCYDMA